MRSYWRGYTPEQRLEKVQRELDAARRTILGLMPDDLRALFEDYYRVESREDPTSGRARSTTR